MADFSTMLSQIYDFTKRPDLVARTKHALKSATLKVHNRDFYPKDFYETGVQFDTSDFVQQLSYKTLIPRWRQPDYIRKSDVDSALGNFIEFLTPAQTVDRYNVNKDDVAYLSGDVLNIRSSDSLQYIILGCWLYPDVSETTYTSWIADEMPYLILLEAAAFIAATTGDIATANGLRKELLGDPDAGIPGLYAMLDAQIVTKPAV